MSGYCWLSSHGRTEELIRRGRRGNWSKSPLNHLDVSSSRPQSRPDLKSISRFDLNDIFVGKAAIWPRREVAGQVNKAPKATLQMKNRTTCLSLTDMSWAWWQMARQGRYPDLFVLLQILSWFWFPKWSITWSDNYILEAECRLLV